MSYAYRYMRGAGNAAPAPAAQTTTKKPYDWSKYIINKTGPGTYLYQDRSPICLAAYDMEAKPPRRLEVGFLENNVAGGLVNGAYGPPFNEINNTAAGGPREFLLVFDLPYTDPAKGENSKILLDNGLITATPTVPIMWVVFANRRQVARFPQDGDTFLMTANHVNTVADVFEFKTTPPVIDSNALAKEDLKTIRAVPNPYYGQSAYELSSLARIVRFTHLPKQCMIKVFSLGGDLVRTFNHTDGTSMESWDLKTDHGLPVASGVYIALIEAPGIGTHIVKMAIFMEAERLDNF